MPIQMDIAGKRNIQRALDPIITPSGAWDTGVEVSLIERLRDNYLEKTDPDIG